MTETEPTTTPKELTTEVTSVAQEELKTGVKIQTPNADDLARKAGISFIRSRKAFNEVFSGLSARGKTRVMNAVLDLPTDGVPVFLRGEQEKLGFALGQRVITDRFVITQHHIVQEVKRQRAEAEATKETEENKVEETLDKENDKS